MYAVLRYACRALQRAVSTPQAHSSSLNCLPDEVLLIIAELLTPEHALPTAPACKAWCRAVVAASTFAVGAGLRFATLDYALRLAPAFATLLLHESDERDTELVLSKDVRLKGAAGARPSATVLPALRTDSVHVALQNLTVSGSGGMRAFFCEDCHVTAKAVHIHMHVQTGNTLWRWAVMASRSNVLLEDCAVVCTHLDVAADVPTGLGETVVLLHTVHGAIGVCGNEESTISLRRSRICGACIGVTFADDTTVTVDACAFADNRVDIIAETGAGTLRASDSTFRDSTVASVCLNGLGDDVLFERCSFDSLRCNLSFESRMTRSADETRLAAAARRLLHGNYEARALEPGRHRDDEAEFTSPDTSDVDEEDDEEDEE